MKKIFYLLLMLALTACASPRGFDRGAMREQVFEKTQFSAADGGVKTQVLESDIKETLRLRPQLPQPFKLAVYFADGAYSRYYNRWSWRKEDKDLVMKLLEGLKATGQISEVVYLSEFLVVCSDCYRFSTLDVRVAAARAGADAVLIIRGSSDTDKYNNFLGATYALLLPMFFMPGTVVDAYFIANATMWDVRNQYLYLSDEADGTASQTRPTFFVEEKDVVMAAKTQAMNKLTKDLSEHMGKLLGK